MAWPFSNIPAPSFNTDLVAVPAVLTTVSGGGQYLMGILLSNPTADTITFTITNSAGAKIVPDVDVLPKTNWPIDLSFLPCNGLKWVASAVGGYGQLWGY